MMLKKVAADIYKIALPMDYNFGYANSYLIKDDEGYAIFDTGENRQEVKEIWEDIIADGYDIKKVYVTHMHPDHIGLVHWFKKSYDTEVIIAELGYEMLLEERKRFVDGIYQSEDMETLIKRYGGPEIKPFDYSYYKYETYQFEPTQMFKAGDMLKVGQYAFKAIWTPGHSPDHFCFYDDASGIIITGDHILPHINPIVVPRDKRKNKLKIYLDAVDKLTSLEARLALPGHEGVFEGLNERIKEMKLRYNQRFRQIIESVQQKSKTPFEISEEVYKNNAPTSMMQTFTYIVFLEELGYLSITERGGVYQVNYKTAPTDSVFV